MRKLTEYVMALLKNKFFRIGLLAFGLLILLQTIAALTIAHSFERQLNKLQQSVEFRIAKDLSRLPVPDPEVNIVGNKEVVVDYIREINSHIASKTMNFQVTSIQGFAIDHNPMLTNKVVYFETPNNRIELVLSYKALELMDYVSVVSVILAVVFAYLLVKRNTMLNLRKYAVENAEVEENAKLIIDLENKVLINSLTQKSVPLANKPLCFYTALIEFCITDKETTLNQNKELPDELAKLSNKYFYRLIELGHTIRKRPNFSNSLEKTLSEIRAAVDELFQNDPEVRELYFPPKAHGEGSRSKLHHYGLSRIELDDVEIIGK